MIKIKCVVTKYDYNEHDENGEFKISRKYNGYILGFSGDGAAIVQDIDGDLNDESIHEVKVQEWRE